MGELLMLFITGGGSTAMGAILKGVFGYVFESKQQKHDLEMAREARNNDNFLRLQAEINKSGNGEFVSFTRRVLAVIGVSTLCSVYHPLYPLPHSRNHHHHKRRRRRYQRVLFRTHQLASSSRAAHYFFWTHQPYGMHSNTALYPRVLLWSKWSKRLTVKHFSLLLIFKFNRQLATTSPSTLCGGQSCEDERCESHW